MAHAGYFVLLVDINDHDRYAKYARAVPPTYARYGGRMAVRGPGLQIIEGVLEAREDTRLAVLEFESVDQARAWWTSQDYQASAKMSAQVSRRAPHLLRVGSGRGAVCDPGRT